MTEVLLAKNPTVRFEKYTENWSQTKLGKLVNFYKGKGLSKNDIERTGEKKCIRYGELYTDYNEVITDILSRTNIPENESFLSRENDVLIPSSGETAIDIAKASCVLEDKILLGGDINVLRPYEKVYGPFLAYCLSNKKRVEIAKLSQGYTVAHIYSSQLKDLKVYIPSYDEQKSITSFLTKIDKRIELLQKKKDKLEEYKKGMMQKIFSQEIRFKADSGEEFKPWGKKKLTQCVDHYGGTALEKYVSPAGDYKFISIGNYSTKGKYIDDGKRIPLNDVTKNKRLKKNDLVMVLNDKTSSGDIIGSTILIDSDSYIYNQRSERLVCKPGFSSLYMWHLLNSAQIRREIFKLSQGGTQIYVNYSTVEKISLLMPQFEEQQKIASFLSSIDKKIELTQKQIDQTTLFKKALLQQMFV